MFSQHLQSYFSFPHLGGSLPSFFPSLIHSCIQVSASFSFNAFCKVREDAIYKTSSCIESSISLIFCELILVKHYAQCWACLLFPICDWYYTLAPSMQTWKSILIYSLIMLASFPLLACIRPDLWASEMEGSVFEAGTSGGMLRCRWLYGMCRCLWLVLLNLNGICRCLWMMLLHLRGRCHCLCMMPVNFYSICHCLIMIAVNSRDRCCCIWMMPVNFCGIYRCLCNLPVNFYGICRCLWMMPVNSRSTCRCIWMMPVNLRGRCRCISMMPVNFDGICRCLWLMPVNLPTIHHP